MEPTAVISFDSHIDDNLMRDDLGVLEKSQEAVESLSFTDRSVFNRVSVHSLLGLSKKIQHIPKYVVMPHGSCIDKLVMGGRTLENLDYLQDNVVEKFKALTEKMSGLRIFFSPPRDLKYLFKKVQKHSTVVDFDIDYFEELQNYCYTKAPKLHYNNGTTSKIGSVKDFFKTINHVLPDTVILSEIRRAQIKNPSLPFLKMLNFLRDKGYEIEYQDLVESDKIANDAISKHSRFLEKLGNVRKRLISSPDVTIQELRNSLKEADKNQAELLKKYYNV